MSSTPTWRQPDNPDIVRHQRIRCPHCKKRIDAATAAEGPTRRPPQTGDFSICFGCGEPAVYEVDAAGVTLRKATPEERAECVAENAGVFAALRAFHAAQRRR